MCLLYCDCHVPPPPFPDQLTGKCGSVLVRLIPAPRGTSIVAAGVSKKLLTMAGVSDCYTSARGQTATLGNFGMPVMTCCIIEYCDTICFCYC